MTVLFLRMVKLAETVSTPLVTEIVYDPSAVTVVPEVKELPLMVAVPLVVIGMMSSKYRWPFSKPEMVGEGRESPGEVATILELLAKVA